jgi:NADH-quinone oxidoreductase subunit G
MLALKDLMAALGSANLDCRQDGAKLQATRRDFYTFNTSIAGIDEADAILLIGTNPRREAPVLNARIRKRYVHAQIPIASIGAAADLTYPVQHLGEGPSAIGTLGAFGDTLRAAKKPMIVLGQGALARPDGGAVMTAAWKLAAEIGALLSDWHGFNVLHTAAARVGALDLGFLPGANGKAMDAMLAGGVDLLWLLGADEFDTGAIPSGCFVVYQGHHGDRGAARADVILPGSAYTEKSGTYVNTEGRVQRGYAATHPPGEAREDWKILRAFAQTVGVGLPYDDLPALRARLEQVSPVFARVGFLPRFGITDHSGPAGDPTMLSEAGFEPAIADYYLTDPISRASPTMAECSAVFAAPALAAE